MSYFSPSRYNRVMVVFSAVFLGAAIALTQLWGSVGFILANCINMFTRIVHRFGGWCTYLCK